MLKATIVLGDRANMADVIRRKTNSDCIKIVAVLRDGWVSVVYYRVTSISG